MPLGQGIPIQLVDDQHGTGGRPRGIAMFVKPAQMATPTNIITVKGVSRDGNGNALGGCTVKLYRTSNDAEIASQVSDAGGNFAFAVNNGYGPFYAVGYLPGSPDRSGATVNTLTAA